MGLCGGLGVLLSACTPCPAVVMCLLTCYVAGGIAAVANGGASDEQAPMVAARRGRGHAPAVDTISATWMGYLVVVCSWGREHKTSRLNPVVKAVLTRASRRELLISRYRGVAWRTASQPDF